MKSWKVWKVVVNKTNFFSFFWRFRFLEQTSRLVPEHYNKDCIRNQKGTSSDVGCDGKILQLLACLKVLSHRWAQADKCIKSSNFFSALILCPYAASIYDMKMHLKPPEDSGMWKLSGFSITCWRQPQMSLYIPGNLLLWEENVLRGHWICFGLEEGHSTDNWKRPRVGLNCGYFQWWCFPTQSLGTHTACFCSLP